MSDTKWTPGPWFVGAPNVAQWSSIGVHSDDYVICDLCSDAPLPQKANAHIIAAAPVLAEELRKASQLCRIAADWNLDEVEIDGEMVSVYELQDAFDSALAKAQGETKETT